MKDDLAKYVQRVKDLADHVKGNEQATKQSLIGPLLTLLGYDLTDPRECVPEFRADFGKERSAKPVDWAFLQDGKPIFFVEAKEAGRKLAGFDEQLADYFAKEPLAKLGILSNGLVWRFFTDIEAGNIMDKQPFAVWDVLGDQSPPYDLLTLLQKSAYDSDLIRTFAQKKRNQNLLVGEISRLLEPSADFIKLAVANIETRRLSESVLEHWKPVVQNAITDWVLQRRLQGVLADQQPLDGADETPKVETTKEEMDAFELVKMLLGAAKPVAYEDTKQYFKIHVPGHAFYGAVCRLYFGKRKMSVWVPLPLEHVIRVCPEAPATSTSPNWTSLALTSLEDLKQFAPVFGTAYDCQAAACKKEVASDG